MTMTSYTHLLRLLAIPLPLFLLLFSLHAEVSAGDLQNALEPKPVHSFRHLRQLLRGKSIHTNSNYRLKVQEAGGSLAVFSDTEVLVHSETNVQVAGVDEGDSVKTDGRHIYRIQDGQIRIVRARPAANMAVVSSIQFDGGFFPSELYVHNGLLVVIGTGWVDNGASGDVPVMQANGRAKLAMWAPSGESRTMAKVYDISDRAAPVLKREIAFSGDYLSSRRIGNSVYLIGRKYPHFFMHGFAGDGPVALRKQRPRMTRNNLLPRIVDSAANNGSERPLPIKDLYFFPDFVEPDYVVVAGFRLNALDEEASIKAFLGSGDIVYASKDNLYLSAADYNINPDDGQTVSAPATHVYKFALADGAVEFSKTGEIPGVALNSYSMDEHEGYFRIATTTDQWTQGTQSGDGGWSQTWNNLYTLDKDMNIAGRLEHLAKGERIVSARFMGDRGYLGTFQQFGFQQQTAPLLVIDLATPQSPKVLGELKIPGFSNYLHPYDDTHLLGFGQDTEETVNGVVTTGMKVALFDVTDVTRPSQMHSLTIGAQGSHSPVQWDPKALLFNKKTGLLGFPASITEKRDGADWPVEVFQGALVYQVSLDQGFTQRAKITHLPDGFKYDWHHYIDRLLTIGNQLYTLSPARIQANDLTHFTLTGGLDIPIQPMLDDCSAPVSDEVKLALVSIDCPISVDPIVVEPIVVDPIDKPTVIN